MEQAIWSGNGLRGEARMEGDGAGNLGWKRVKWGNQNERGWSRQFGVETGYVGVEGGGTGNLGWKWVKWGNQNGRGWSRQFRVEKG